MTDLDLLEQRLRDVLAIQAHLSEPEKARLSNIIHEMYAMRLALALPPEQRREMMALLMVPPHGHA